MVFMKFSLIQSLGRGREVPPSTTPSKAYGHGETSWRPAVRPCPKVKMLFPILSTLMLLILNRSELLLSNYTTLKSWNGKYLPHLVPLGIKIKRRSSLLKHVSERSFNPFLFPDFLFNPFFLSGLRFFDKLKHSDNLNHYDASHTYTHLIAIFIVPVRLTEFTHVKVSIQYNITLLAQLNYLTFNNSVFYLLKFNSN